MDEHDEKVSGEYFIDNHGDVTFCDDVASETNHDGVAMGYALRKIAEPLGIEQDETDGEMLKQEMHSLFAEEFGWADHDKLTLLEMFLRYLKETTREGDYLNEVQDRKYWKLIFLAAFLNYGEVLAKDIAIEHWGWIAVKGQHCYMWKLNTDTRTNLLRGLENICEEESIVGEPIWSIYDNKRNCYEGTIPELREYNIPQIAQNDSGNRRYQIEQLDKGLRHECYKTGSE